MARLVTLCMNILIIILSKVPLIRDLIRWRTVNQEWNEAPRQCRFVNMHSDNQEAKFLIQFNSSERTFGISSRTFEVHSRYSFRDTVGFGCCMGNKYYGGSCSIAGSYNGILCVRGTLMDGSDNDEHVYLWNPSIKKLRELPQPPLHTPFQFHMGFGSCHNNKNYKIVRLSKSTNDTPNHHILICTEVFRFYENKWIVSMDQFTVERPQIIFDRNGGFQCDKHPVFCHNNFNWIVDFPLRVIQKQLSPQSQHIPLSHFILRMKN
ncbi:uncharacterized protein LOC133806495 [Humulus lupulus]|uniref:uncharacterized protein LOC133806495 n=1 Tax=Humulus lupulus TaxID=3486 RepID=UPI002B414B32|nr:uncharacterized protein LOC133806495 [Humulus lupulus]